MVLLREMLERDIEDYVRWFTRETEWMRWDAPWEDDLCTEEEARREWTEYYRSVRNRPADALRNKFEIEADGKHVGWVSAYRDTSPFENPEGYYAVGIDIPEEKDRNRGYGTEAMRQFIALLRKRGETCLYTQTWSGNRGMLALAEKLGFKEKARFAGIREVGGKRYDALTLELKTDVPDIVFLPPERWKGFPIPMRYTTETYYDVVSERTEDGWKVRLVKKRFDEPVTHTPEEYDFPDKLYAEHWSGAKARGIVSESGELLACIETAPEEWSNRLIVTEMWVAEGFRRQGIGHRLMALAKKQAAEERRRALILETQSCNTGAVAFYESEGFRLIGWDLCCYSNRDIERREVRMNMGLLF